MAQRTKEQDRFHRQGFASGTAVAAAIIVNVWGEQRMAAEILGAAGLRTRAQMKRLGVDDYDLDILKPVFAAMRRKRCQR